MKHRPERPSPAPRDPAAESGGGAESERSEGDEEAEAPPAGPTPESAAPAPPETEEPPAVLRDRWLRAEAELQNYRRRAQRDAEESRRSAEERVMLEIIGALDDLDRALEAAPGSGASDAWTEGVRLVARRLRESLGRHGVVMVDPVGQPFDPSLHEAILEMDSPEGAAPGTVVQVVLKGYARGGRALRPARVVVARARG